MRLDSRHLRLILLFTAMIMLIVLVVRQYLPAKSISGALEQKGQKYGSFVNTQGEVPGNPEKAEDNLKLLCRLYSTYLRNHREEYLVKASKNNEDLFTAVMKDMSTHREDYREFQGLTLLEQMHNPDTQYSDNYAGRMAQNAFIYNENPFRPDGTPVGGPKAPGTRDVLAQTSIYFHRNTVSSKNKGTPSTFNPVGFYLVLWDDCSVERIPYFETLMAPMLGENGSYRVCYRGQAGVPPGALTYDEFNAKFMRAKKPLRGKPGIIGMTLNGDEVKN